MLKKILLSVFTLLALSVTPTWADEPVSAQPENTPLLPAQIVPAETVPAAPTSAAAEPATKPAGVQSSQLKDDHHADYRYCLELKSNREIAECRYKKK